MKLFIGLGNPGTEYQLSRHNAGFMVIDELRSRLTDQPFKAHKKTSTEVAKIGSALLIKPQTFMNDSGRAVNAVLEYFFADQDLSPELFVIHDDLDLVIGSYKIQFGKGPKVHNGLSSIYQHLGSDQFWHVRIGVDGRNGRRQSSGKDYVLSNFSKDEKKIFDDVCHQVVEALLSDK